MKTFEVTMKVCIKTSNMKEAKNSANILLEDILSCRDLILDNFTIKTAECERIGEVTR